VLKGEIKPLATKIFKKKLLDFLKQVETTRWERRNRTKNLPTRHSHTANIFTKVSGSICLRYLRSRCSSLISAFLGRAQKSCRIKIKIEQCKKIQKNFVAPKKKILVPATSMPDFSGYKIPKREKYTK
jgi:hypothetical protein